MRGVEAIMQRLLMHYDAHAPDTRHSMHRVDIGALVFPSSACGSVKRGGCYSEGITLCLQVVAELGAGLAVGPQAGFGVELVGHGGGGHHRLEAARALGHVLLRVQQHHVHLGHVEEPQGHGGAQAHGDGQRGGLDVHLQQTTEQTQQTG